MLEAYSYQAYPETRFAPADRKRAISTLPTPRLNHLLAALPPEDYERLLPDLEPVSLPLGWSVYGAGDQRKYLYFLTAGIVLRCQVTEGGASAELAVTGSEGVIGVASLLGGGRAPNEALVVSAGYAYRLRLDRLLYEIEHGGPLLHLLLRYTMALIVQTGQIAVCNRHHSLKQQLCRWILSCLDRSPSNELKMTHELIADILGVRREGVTEAAGKLQKAGLIHYHRGHIAVLDRRRLEAQACECYAVVKTEYNRLLSPEDISRGAGAHGTGYRHSMEWSPIRC